MNSLARSSALALALVSLGAVFGCASTPPPAAPAAVPAKVAAAPTKPRCAADAPDRPSGSDAVMASLGADVKRCFALATGSRASQVAVTLDVREDGTVSGAAVDAGATPNTAAIECTVKAARALTFARYCGDEISVRWRYGLQ